MTTPHLKKSIGRSPLRLGFFLPALAVACFALLPFAAADAAPVCHNSPNVTDENDAARARKIHIVSENAPHFTTTKPCAASEQVRLSGGVVVKFKVNGNRKLVPDSTDLENFHGQGLATQHAYVANKSDVSLTRPEFSTVHIGSGVLKIGEFDVIVWVTDSAPPNRRFFLKWTVLYRWSSETKKLTSFNLVHRDKPQCEPDTCN